MEYHEKLRKFFSEKGISQSEAGNRMGYKKSMMSRYLNTATPNMEFIQSLIREWPDVDLNYLFKDQEILLQTEEPAEDYGDRRLQIVDEISEKLNALRKELTQK